jgi:hypothetical protein
VFLPDRDEEAAGAFGQALTSAAAELGYRSRGRPVSVSVRTGIAAAPAGKLQARHWIAAAESACRQACGAGATNTYNDGSIN